MAAPETEQEVPVLLLGEIAGDFDNAAAFIRKAMGVPALAGLGAIFVTGQFFGDDGSSFLPYQKDEKQWPFPTYFIAGEEKWSEPIDGLPNGGSIATNLHYLGDKGITSIAGLQVAFLSGVRKEETYNCQQRNIGKYDPYYVRNDTKIPYNSKIDVALTCEWPCGWKNLNSEIENPGREATSISYYIQKCCPKYHFSTSPQQVKFTPYINPTKGHETWFVSVGGFDITKKHYFACRIKPFATYTDQEYNRLVPDKQAVAFPYRQKQNVPKSQLQPRNKGKKRRREETGLEMKDGFRVFKKSKPGDDYRCKRCSQQGHFVGDCPLNAHGPPENYICKRCEKPGHWVYQCSIRDSFTKPKCFLCFGSEKYDKKMVVASDGHVYISCAKGPLINEDFIIASKQHASSLNSHNTDLANVLIQKLAKAMAPKTLVIVDRRYGTSPGAHDFWEVFAIMPDQIEQFKNILKIKAKQYDLKFGYLPPNMNLKEALRGAPHHLSFTLLDKQETMVAPIRRDRKLPVNLHRMVLAELLGVPERINWKQCVMSDLEEVELAIQMRNRFNEASSVNVGMEMTN